MLGRYRDQFGGARVAKDFVAAQVAEQAHRRHADSGNARACGHAGNGGFGRRVHLTQPA